MATSTSSDEGQKPRRVGIADDARLLFGAVDSALRETETTLARMMRERPLLTIGAAAGVGYLLGGGLTPRVAARLVSTGGRMMLAATVERWLVDQLGLAPETSSARTAEDDSRKEVRR